MDNKLLLGLLFLISLSHGSLSEENEDPYRLPTSIIPLNYTINLEFIGAAFSNAGNTFDGFVEIYINIVEDTDFLKFHASNQFIEINNITLNNELVTKDDNGYSINEATDIVTIPLKERELKKNTDYLLQIYYKGRISTTDNYGIYRSTYTYDQVDSFLLATQFEPTYARRAFPCFDEPSFKAEFTVSIKYYNGFSLNALFNTRAKETNEKKEEGFTEVTFETTPKMSTYLLAFVISDFTNTTSNAIEGETDSTEFNVWSRDDLASSRKFAAEVAPQLLLALEHYTDLKYRNDADLKIDQVALPDFAAGAMENWGLVTYRERLLLFDEDNNQDTVKQSIATVIAHEFAHQWFGNLITCNWWSETYLNEGFATYFEYFATHQVFPSWQLDYQFVVSALHPAMSEDSLESAQALKSDASTPTEITNKFGTISYSKGGSILRMLSLIMGETEFQKAIQRYVKSDLQYGTATSSKLWKHFEENRNQQLSYLPANTTIENVMEYWIEKSGYPLLTVTLDGKSLKISQERFLISGEDKKSKWYVPITFVESESETKFQIAFTSAWLTPSTPEITIELEFDNSWVLVNTLELGYYRVNYDENLWKNIADALQKENFDSIHELNRAQIVDDLFNIAKANKKSYPDVLNIIDFLKHDVSYFSWVPALSGFEYMLLRIPNNSQLKAKIQGHILSLMEKIYNTVPINKTNEDQIYTKTQLLAAAWACKLGQENCVSESKKLFAESIKGNKPHKNVRSIVYCNGLRYSNNTSDYEYLWKIYKESEDSNEKVTLLAVLGCSTNAEKLKELLAETLKTNSAIRTQDAASTFAAVYGGSQEGVDVALDFVIDNFDAILNKYTAMSATSTVIKGIAGRLTTSEQIEKLKTFIKGQSHFEKDLKEVGEEALELAEANLKWISAHQNDLEKYFGLEKDGSSRASNVVVNFIVFLAVSIIGYLNL